ncbi:MAG: ATP-binding protein [Acidobacteriota bacterium]
MEVVLHLPAVPNVELVAAKAVETLGEAMGMHRDGIEAVSVALVEACLNAMEHGGSSFVVRLAGEDGVSPRMRVEVEDQGRGFDPDACPPDDSTRIHGCVSKRGWGLTLIRELMDDVQISSRPGLTRVCMWKELENAP